jgi:enamine deaminase RidA (YjgF/YER057c/UK114 family)
MEYLLMIPGRDGKAAGMRTQILPAGIAAPPAVFIAMPADFASGCTKNVQNAAGLRPRPRGAFPPARPPPGRIAEHRIVEPTMRQLDPARLPPPFARYAHGVEVPAGARLVVTSGQLGIAADGTVPADAGAQAALCFAHCAAILAEAGMGPADVIRINAFVTDRAYMPAYMAARDAWLAGVSRLPASTLVIVSGFTRPEFLVEVEVTAARA